MNDVGGGWEMEALGGASQQEDGNEGKVVVVVVSRGRGFALLDRGVGAPGAGLFSTGQASASPSAARGEGGQLRRQQSGYKDSTWMIAGKAPPSPGPEQHTWKSAGQGPTPPG